MADYDPKPYLERYGYLWYARSNVGPGASIDEVLKLAIRTFQERFRLEVTGEVDEETIKSMKMPRCGNMDFSGGGNGLSLYYSKPEDFDHEKFLEAFGFLGLARDHLAKGGGGGADEEEVLEVAVEKFQETYGFPVTGELGEETVERMKMMARGYF